MKWFETTTTVRWSEVDFHGIVYYANYYIYFDLIREHIAQNVDFNHMDKGIHMLTRNCNATYYSSARYRDELILRGRLDRASVAKYTFHYRVLRKVGKQLLAEGSSDHIFLDRNTNRLQIDSSRHENMFTKADIFLDREKG